MKAFNESGRKTVRQAGLILLFTEKLADWLMVERLWLMEESHQTAAPAISLSAMTSTGKPIS